MGELSGRAAVVTGAGSGLGRATAVELASRGAAVLIADLQPETANETADHIQALGGVAEPMEVDVTDYPSVEQMVKAATGLGPLRIAVNNAGIAGEGARVAEYSLDGWARLMRVNLDGVFHSMKAELPELVAAGGGSIVNVASVLGIVGRANAVAYVAAKHGVVGLTRTAALEYGSAGVRVNAVAPGFVLTGLNSERLDGPERERLREATSLGRLGEAHEIARLVAFLAGDGASYMTGGCHTVDGGYSAQ